MMRETVIWEALRVLSLLPVWEALRALSLLPVWEAVRALSLLPVWEAVRALATAQVGGKLSCGQNDGQTDRKTDRLFSLVIKTKVVQNVNRMSER